MTDRTRDARAEQAIRRRVALNIGQRAGWWQALAVDQPTGRYVFGLDHGRVRELSLYDTEFWVDRFPHRVDEVYWWMLGMADVRGSRVQLDGPIDVPDLISLDDAATVLGLSVHTVVQNRVPRGDFDVVYLAQRDRRLFADQVRASIGDDQAAQRWTQLRDDLALPGPTVALNDYQGPAPSPDPLPVPPARSQTDRRLLALAIGTQAGWFQHLVTDTQKRTYIVEFPIRRPGSASSQWHERTLPAEAVLPWALGVGDALGQGSRVAYRDGLG